MHLIQSMFVNLTEYQFQVWVHELNPVSGHFRSGWTINRNLRLNSWSQFLELCTARVKSTLCRLHVGSGLRRNAAHTTLLIVINHVVKRIVAVTLIFELSQSTYPNIRHKFFLLCCPQRPTVKTWKLGSRFLFCFLFFNALNIKKLTVF